MALSPSSFLFYLVNRPRLDSGEVVGECEEENEEEVFFLPSFSLRCDDILSPLGMVKRLGKGRTDIPILGTLLFFSFSPPPLTLPISAQ